MYYVLFDSEGNYKTTYIPGVNCEKPPSGAIQTSEEDWRIYTQNGGNDFKRDADGTPQKKPPYIQTTVEKLTAIRRQRDQLLGESDWTDTLSAKSRLGETLYIAWQEYRQALRDMPKTCDVDNLVWPEKPL
ncbi:phage tail assembly chaperone [Sporomusa sp.]|uniref:phage tail assembly chaperone n=1 Tax=Sporomusa sp. TaxID=2078658 RepID=UPI002B566FCF|nr:phage tail assembly chaperone [Sporomusa sp.]HWR06294.1 phage tail assembly chaperone [Sporomusa sp.]